ncbi:MAG: class I SAM-dependent methyltransferase [Myxococcota bacterium]
MRALPLRMSLSIDRLRNRLRPGVHQRSHVTGWHRYPVLFREVRRVAEQERLERPHILSFGCSSGEECASLSEQFPGARVVGTDISPRMRARAQRIADENPAVVIVPSRDDLVAAFGPYDIVFALSVLCRHQETRHVDNCARVYPFERFETAAARLANWVAPGGLLVLYNTTFRFQDTLASEDFVDVTPPAIAASGTIAQFDREHRRLDQPDRACIFRKRETHG